MAKSKPADKLAPYRAKRDAGRTPEPFGGTPIARPGLFVVQKHAARSLHFDFRLELDGVLVSWAVPKGPSPNPADKRLAMHVEDHPLEYGDFEGTIPKENYGAGAVIVWDKGLWTAREDPWEGLKKGKLLFDLAGYKLRGLWTLVRIKGSGSGKEWLLIKERDGHVRKDGELPQESVVSGLTVEELRDGSTKAGKIAAALERLKAPRRLGPAKEIDWMLAEARDVPPSGEGWLFEIKYDGYRLLAFREDGQSKLRFRGGGDASASFPEITRVLAGLPYERIILDGEVVVLDDEGRPSFGRLQKRARLTRRADIDRASLEFPTVFFAFDLLAFGDRDTRSLPLTERKRLLQELVPSSGPIRFADHVEGQGVDLLEAAQRMGLEGIVCKRAASPYRRGRSADWIKVRFHRADDFVIVGFTAPERGRVGLGALHLAVRAGDGYRYAGRVGTGFNDRQLEDLRHRLDAQLRESPVVTGTLPKGREHVWTNPEIVCEVRYKEWTTDGQLRHPVFLRVRDDKRPEECADPEEPSAKAEEIVDEPVALMAPAPPIERTVRFTNVEKVFWPEDGHTKGDLIAYYRAISPWILHYLRDRPVVMTRFPDGIHGKSFFQKDAPGFSPEWLRKESMWSEQGGREIDYFICDDEPSLLYVINLGTIPLHVWSSRVESLQRPDWCILDLDPKGAPFANVVKVALAARRLCEDLELPVYLKTSGSTGLHVLIPLGRQCTFEDCRVLGELLARVLVMELGEIATIARSLDARDGKVYIDFLQNGHGKLLVAPFSARPVPGALVSTPLRWSEATSRLDPSRFTIETLPGRMKKMKADPLAAVLEEAPDLSRALDRLGKRLAR